ncbi:MAG: hypothetical protein HYS33_08940 [Acidobacteria bacterium]|nr:hypothetical protein [Acidobacteriota bacterium]MBI1984202.1 hypothetical protein [Acidobacteriota bacterium]
MPNLLKIGIAATFLAATTLLAAAFSGPAAQILNGAPPPALASDSPSLLSSADEILAEMSRITGLPIKAPLEKRIVTRLEIEKYLRESLHAEYTDDEIHTHEALLKALGLVSPEFDLEKFIIHFYTEQAAGVYDPRRKVMLIADWLEPQMQKLVLAHELTHALQDQNFEIRQFLRGARANHDATTARQAIAEGFATAAMMQHMLGGIDLGNLPSLEPLLAGMVGKQMEAFPAFSNAPFFFRLQALFPYTRGMTFMQEGLARGGWKKLGELFEHPPASTKEVLEPQFYYSGKTLPRFSLPRPEPLARVAALRLLEENVLGQLGYYALLGQLISEDEAKEVAPGWLADRYILYKYEGAAPARYALVARTRWSSPETALAFFRDYHTILGGKYPGLTPDPRSTTDLFVGTATSRTVILLRRGDEVRWAEGIPAAKADAMLEWLRGL